MLKLIRKYHAKLNKFWLVGMCWVLANVWPEVSDCILYDLSADAQICFAQTKTSRGIAAATENKPSKTVLLLSCADSGWMCNYSKHHHYLYTPWWQVAQLQLQGHQLVSGFNIHSPTNYGTWPSLAAVSYSAGQEILCQWIQRFVTMFTEAHQWNPSQASTIQFTPSQLIFLRPISVLSHHLCLDSQLVSSLFLTKILYHFLFLPCMVLVPPVNLQDLISLKTLGTENKVWSS